jgi:hippurate hydrolase
MITALQSVASRFTDPFDPVVLSTTFIEGGNDRALNVIPASAKIGGTIRTMRPDVREAVERRFREIVTTSAKLFEAEAQIDWRPGYPVVVNDPEKTKVAIAVATDVAGNSAVNTNYAQSMGSEDFAYMLQQRPGAIVLVGNGDSANLHHPAYNFNDDAIIHGVKYWLSLVDRQLGQGVRARDGSARE